MSYGVNTYGYAAYGMTNPGGSIVLDTKSFSPSALIDLYELDATMLGGDKTYFHAGVNGLEQNIVWQGIAYTRYPILVEGFEKTTKGTLPRPTIKVANISGLMSAYAKQYSDLIGAKVTRRRTFAKYLDPINFTNGINPTADPNVSFPDEVWYVDRKSAQTPIFLEYELAASFDIVGVMLPRRQCIQNTCIWKYRGAECGFTGGAVAKYNDQPTTNLSEDVCSKKLSGCKLRFGALAPLPYGGFPGVGLIR